MFDTGPLHLVVAEDYIENAAMIWTWAISRSVTLPFGFEELKAMVYGLSESALLAKAREIQWDYKNLVRHKGRLARLK